MVSTFILQMHVFVHRGAFLYDQGEKTQDAQTAL